MNRTARFGSPFLFITLVSFVIIEEWWQNHPFLASTRIASEREFTWMVVFPHHHFFEQELCDHGNRF